MSDNNPTDEGAQNMPSEGGAPAPDAGAPQPPAAPAAPPAPQYQAPQPPAPQAPQAPAAPQMPAPAFAGAPQAPGGPGSPGAPGGPGAPRPPYGPAPAASKGLAITALILGIVGVVGGLIFGWLPFVGGIITILVGAAAVVLGFIALNKRQSKGMSLTGLIMGGVAVLIGIASIVLWSIAFSQAGSAIDEYSSQLDELSSEMEIEGSADASSTEGSTSDSGTASGEYTAEFCTALDDYFSASGSSSDPKDAAVIDAVEELASHQSPNQSVYQDYLALAKDSSASEADVATGMLDLLSATIDDSMECL
ncbi:DUF4190 domain-containing protein [Leucobacter sp. gxy201]|uniref:hypothetical protein n=1 Tax=Leucobacter sp. gxy201 TaxID=2957200 RepID=UPI003DA0B581